MLFQWLIIASFLAVVGATAATVVGWQMSGELPDPDRVGIAINVAALSVALLISIATGLLMPAWWRRVVAVAVLIPALGFVATSGNALAGLIAVAVLFPTVWLGRKCVAMMPGQIDTLTAWIVGTAFGFGIISAIGFGLGSVGLLRPGIIWPVLLGLTVVLMLTGRRQLLQELRLFYAWLCRPGRCDRVGLMLVGIGIALLWYNVIGALSPETASDTVRVRLATASYFAQTQRLAIDDPELFSITQTPAVGEIADAVVVAIGPLQTANLLTFFQGLVCALAVFAVGRRLHGEQAGLLAAFAFYSMPLVSWLSQTAYFDLLTTLLALSAVLIIVSREVTDWRVATAAGMSSGLGLGVKLHFAYIAVGLAVILGAMALRGKRPRAAIGPVVVMAVTAILTAGPWLLRSTIASGQLPGVTLATQSLMRTQGEQPAVMADLPRFGFGRSLGHLLRSLFDMTMYSAQFEWPPTRYGPFGGLIGFVLLGLLPLLIIVFPSRRRTVLALLAGGATSFLLWFYTAQYLRYGLPILAMLCPLAGVAYVVVREKAGRSALRAMTSLSLLVFVLSGLVIQVQVPAMGRNFALGRENREQYLSRNLICCGGYPVLQLLNAESRATRVLSQVDLARIYTAIRVSIPQTTGGPLFSTGDEPLLLQGLDEGGYSHIVIDRNLLGQDFETVTVLGEAFLRRNTILVGGGENVYLYRILLPDQRGGAHPWAAGRELLTNGSFVDWGKDVPTGWNPVGMPDDNAADQRSHAAVRVDHAGKLITAVTVTPQTRYLLSHLTRSDNGAVPSKAHLSLTWRNGAGETIGETREIVPTSSRGYHQFSMLATAPPGAVTAVVSIQAEGGGVWFDDLSLRSVLPDDALNGAHIRDSAP